MHRTWRIFLVTEKIKVSSIPGKSHGTFDSTSRMLSDFASGSTFPVSRIIDDNVLPALAFTSIVNCEGALASRASVCLVFGNCVLHSFSQYWNPEPNATLLMNSLDFKRRMLGLTHGRTLIQEEQLQLLGDTHIF